MDIKESSTPSPRRNDLKIRPEDDAPELAYDKDDQWAKQVVPQEKQDSTAPEYIRRRSQDLPQPTGGYYSRRSEELPQPADKSVYGHRTEEDKYLASQGDRKKPKRAARRTVAWASLFLFVALAIALGCGLGLTLNKKRPTLRADPNSSGTGNSTTSGTQSSANTTQIDTLGKSGEALSARNLTALSITPAPALPGLLLYYRAPNGSVIEDYYAQDVIAGTQQVVLSSVPSLRSTNRTVINITNIGTHSPLASIAYSLNNNSGTYAWQHLFYADNAGVLYHTNTTYYAATESAQDAHTWSTPETFSNETMDMAHPSISVCTTNGTVGGIRLLFSSVAAGGYRLYDKGFKPNADLDGDGRGDGDPQDGAWEATRAFSDADPAGGAACHVTYQSLRTTTNFFFRDPTDATLMHYSEIIVAEGTKNLTRIDEKSFLDPVEDAVDPTSRIAIAPKSDDDHLYLFYQGKDNHIMHQLNSTYAPPNRTEGRTEWSEGRYNTTTGIAAAWVGGGRSQTLVAFTQAANGSLVVTVPDTGGEILADTYILNG